MKFAYADPPYLGLAARFYGDPTYDDPAAHAALIRRLTVEYADGWVLSLHVPSLQTLLPMCPAGVRVGAWVKPFASFKKGVNPAFAWEPVIFHGGRKYELTDQTERDWHSESITLRRGFRGAKPLGFAQWVLRLLNVRTDLGDTIDDLFPGSGGVREAWQQLPLGYGAAP